MKGPSERNIGPEFSQADVIRFCVLILCTPILHALMTGDCDGSHNFFQMMAKHQDSTEAVLRNQFRIKGWWEITFRAFSLPFPPHLHILTNLGGKVNSNHEKCADNNTKVIMKYSSIRSLTQLIILLINLNN